MHVSVEDPEICSDDDLGLFQERLDLCFGDDLDLERDWLELCLGDDLDLDLDHQSRDLCLSVGGEEDRVSELDLERRHLCLRLDLPLCLERGENI